MSQTYKITLTPIGAFYFGGEESFSSAPLETVASDENVAKEYFKKRQGYFAKSEKFPQQTQILGMLRKELLRINEKLYYFKNFVTVPKMYKDEAKKIVGSTRWSIDDDLDLGAIESISPVYLQENDKLYIPAPYDYGLTLEEDGKGYINGKKSKAYAFKKEDGSYFGAKDSLCSDFIAKDESLLELDKIFTSFTQTQNQTLAYKEDDDEQLFKVKKYRLKEGVSFLFYLTMANDSFKNDEYRGTIELGGERSAFVMHIQKSELPDIQKEFSFLANATDRILLTSDAYIEADILHKCKLALAQKRVFRTLKGIKFSKTTKTVLLSRGSIFYPKVGEKQNIIKDIKNKTNFSKIGYNQCIDLTQGATNV